MKLGRVLLIVKRSQLSIVEDGRTRSDARLERLIDERHHATRPLALSHEEHLASARQVRMELRDRGIAFVERARMPDQPVRGYDLVITIGGDGTLLRASHAVRGATMLLGVNSAPTFSVGFLTACRAPTFARTLDALSSEELKPIEVRRLRVRIGRRVVPVPVLNDVLFCHDNPAVTTRYRLMWRHGDEAQKSSGVWIAAPAGTTAAFRSAGGSPVPLGATDLAFIVREPYAPPGSTVRFMSGVLPATEELRIECQISDASVFVDGSHRRYPVPFGDVVGFSIHPQPLLLVRPHA